MFTACVPLSLEKEHCLFRRMRRRASEAYNIEFKNKYLSTDDYDWEKMIAMKLMAEEEQEKKEGRL